LAMNRGCCLLQPYCNSSVEQFVYLVRGFVLHVGQQMRVSLKGDGDVGMSECLLNHLGVGADRQHQGGAGVTQVVEAGMSGSPARRSNGLKDLFTRLRRLMRVPSHVGKSRSWSCQRARRGPPALQVGALGASSGLVRRWRLASRCGSPLPSWGC
jgi:hypothetical protein